MASPDLPTIPISTTQSPIGDFLRHDELMASYEFPQVWEVRIPDPDCTLPFLQCASATIQVEGGAVQAELWKYDLNHDHVLDVNDLAGDPALALPSMAVNRLAQLVVGTQLITKSESAFKSVDDLLNVARTTVAVNQAYDTIEWLNSLSSKHINRSSNGLVKFSSINFDSNDWEKIVERLGDSGTRYATQVNRSAQLFHATIAKIPGVQSVEFSEWRGNVSSSYKEGTDFFIDPTATPFGLRGLVTDWSRKMFAVYDFAVDGRIECAGSNCPPQFESPYPYEKGTPKGLLIALRMDDEKDCKQCYFPFKTHYWSGESTRYDDTWKSFATWLSKKGYASLTSASSTD